jgi:tetratricopeptide (TPR) repeat protein
LDREDFGVAAIKRAPTPPGPISDLFDRLDDLHSKAGRPSVREIAIRAGRGNISPSTVHNVFRLARVPRWIFLERVIGALGGAEEREAFLSLWEEAWRAENDAAPPRKAVADPVRSQGRGVRRLPELPPRPLVKAPPADASGRAAATARPAQRIWSTEIPARNLNFTGRAAELDRLSDNLFGRRQPPPLQVISGMGGVGKTELATEYIHRNLDRYEIIWWIRAEHPDRVGEALVRLGRRLGMRQAGTGAARDKAVAAVLATLESGPWPSWLLVFDNAADSLAIERYLPASRPHGHVIITARQRDRPSAVGADDIEVWPFSAAEAVSYLRRTVPSLTEATGLAAVADTRRASAARQLATALGHWPIAVEHAAAYLAETGQSVEQYLTRFNENARQLLSEQSTDADRSAPVAGTCAMSITLLTPDAEHLFNLCSFFSAEPVAAELFLLAADGIDAPPGVPELLSSPQRFRAAAAQLRRLSLAMVDGARDLIQLHRVVQAVTQGRLRLDRIEAFYAYRAAVDTLLARSDPGNPDQASNDQAYDRSLHHLEADHRFLHTKNPALRTLIIDQVRRLHLRGGHAEAVTLGQDALQAWRASLGHDDPQVLALSVEVASAMYVGGRAADAHELILQIRPLLQRCTTGDGLKSLLLGEDLYGADLRAHGRFREALTLDLRILSKFESVFGSSHERTLKVRSNIAVDYRQLGLFREALEQDQRAYENRRHLLGDGDTETLKSLTAVARDKRGLGRYQESLDISRRVAGAFNAADGRESIPWLHACEGFATALRKAGHHWDALQEGEHVLQRCLDYLGENHVNALRAATNLVNDRRAAGDLAGAEELARHTYTRCREAGAPDGLAYTLLVNLASVLRAAGHPDEALPADEQASKGFVRIHDDRHPFTLLANVNYASDLAQCGRLDEAMRVGHETLGKCRRYLGDDHPDTLLAAANLSLDEVAAGDRAAGERRLAEVLRGYERTLTLEHPEARAAAQGTRLTAEIEPYDL